jgi:hypothetical protein
MFKPMRSDIQKPTIQYASGKYFQYLFKLKASYKHWNVVGRIQARLKSRIGVISARNHTRIQWTRGWQFASFLVDKKSDVLPLPFRITESLFFILHEHD